jgi:hypothetical protein
MSVQSGHSKQLDPIAAVKELTERWTGTPVAVTFFSSHLHDGAAISRALQARFPSAQVIGCTTAGEFTQRTHGVSGVSALALGEGTAVRASAALLDLTGHRSLAAAMEEATSQLSKGMGTSIRKLDPARHVGLALIEGLKMREEQINEALGNAAPTLSFVGGSAGDGLEFKQTRVFVNGQQADDGAALMVLETSAPFTVVKSCSFESSGRVFKVTSADEANRVVYELDGLPVLSAYARAVNTDPARLDSTVFMSHPVGLLINNEPWIRSPMRVLPDGGLKFYCKIAAGMNVHLLNSTHLVEASREALEEAAKTLGRPVRGGLAFNCILRRLEIDAKPELEAPFYGLFEGKEIAGFHTYGESWLGHINQTLTALLFG